MSRMAGLEVWNLPGPRAFLDDIAHTVGEGGGLVTGAASALPGLAQALVDLLDNFGAGWSPRRDVVGKAPFVETLRAALRIERGEIGTIAQDRRLSDKIAILEADVRCENDDLAKALAGAVRFWRKRTEDGPNLVLLWADSGELPESVPSKRTLCWKCRGFGRIDVVMWTLAHRRCSVEPIAEFAESLAVEVGDQDLSRVERVASASLDELVRPSKLLNEISGDIDPDRRTKAIWKAQVRAYLPWIEEHRQRFLDGYGHLLRIDDRQAQLGIERKEDIEIGGINHQLQRAGCLHPIERELLHALACMRKAIAHARPCDPNDLSQALAAARRLA